MKTMSIPARQRSLWARAALALAGATLVLRYVEAAVLILPPLDVSAAALLLDIPAAMLESRDGATKSLH